MSRIEEGTLKSFLAGAALAFALGVDAGTHNAIAGDAQQQCENERVANLDVNRSAPSKTMLNLPQKASDTRNLDVTATGR